MDAYITLARKHIMIHWRDDLKEATNTFHRLVQRVKQAVGRTSTKGFSHKTVSLTFLLHALCSLKFESPGVAMGKS